MLPTVEKEPVKVFCMNTDLSLGMIHRARAPNCSEHDEGTLA